MLSGHPASGSDQLVNYRPDERIEHMDGGRDQELDTLLRIIPEGWSRAEIAGQAWGVTRTTRAGGKVISVNAERLGDTEQLGANVWITSEGPVLRPCEVPAEKVMQFLRAAAKVYSD
jgi:peptide-methionine (S)-S-oxide reductase